MNYQIDDPSSLISPQLVFYEKQIDANIEKAVIEALDPKRLWPHVKTHKCREITRKLIAHGVTRFKCATIAECEMAAECGAECILLAYPLVGPNLMRFIRISEAFPQTNWYALFDDYDQLQKMDALASDAKRKISIFIDVDTGLNRTGVPLDSVFDFALKCRQLRHISVEGLHCYDGQNGISSYELRFETIKKLVQREKSLQDRLKTELGSDLMIIAGGTPEFPCYIRLSDFFCSPGTLFLQDNGYKKLFSDMEYEPAAAVMSRVISNPKPGHFTLDCGYKGISSDPSGVRGVIAGLEDVTQSLFQNEEHWAFKMKEGYEDACPKVGDVLYIIPTHICPTSALYPNVPVVNDGKVTKWWEIYARNRKITF